MRHKLSSLKGGEGGAGEDAIYEPQDAATGGSSNELASLISLIFYRYPDQDLEAEGEDAAVELKDFQPQGAREL